MELKEVIKSLRWLSEELRDEKRGMEAKICRVAADRLEKSEREVAREIFAEIRDLTKCFELPNGCVIFSLDVLAGLEKKRCGEQEHLECVITENSCVITCPRCGKRLEALYPYGMEVRETQCCPYCGVRLDAKKPVIIDREYRCPRCKNNKSQLGLFCENCGQAIDWDIG